MPVYEEYTAATDLVRGDLVHLDLFGQVKPARHDSGNARHAFVIGAVVDPIEKGGLARICVMGKTPVRLCSPPRVRDCGRIVYLAGIGSGSLTPPDHTDTICLVRLGVLASVEGTSVTQEVFLRILKVSQGRAVYRK
jgi:hypothetical protein